MDYSILETDHSIMSDIYPTCWHLKQKTRPKKRDSSDEEGLLRVYLDTPPTSGSQWDECSPSQIADSWENWHQYLGSSNKTAAISVTMNEIKFPNRIQHSTFQNISSDHVIVTKNNSDSGTAWILKRTTWPDGENIWAIVGTPIKINEGWFESKPKDAKKWILNFQEKLKSVSEYIPFLKTLSEENNWNTFGSRFTSRIKNPHFSFANYYPRWESLQEPMKTYFVLAICLLDWLDSKEIQQFTRSKESSEYLLNLCSETAENLLKVVLQN